MKRSVVFARSAEKELRNLSVETRKRVGIALRRLEEDVLPAAAKRLKGREELRLRVGDYRVLYVVAADIVTVVAVGHRREVYR